MESKARECKGLATKPEISDSSKDSPARYFINKKDLESLGVEVKEVKTYPAFGK